jgi:hypothetical protein
MVRTGKPHHVDTVCGDRVDGCGDRADDIILASVNIT